METTVFDEGFVSVADRLIMRGRDEGIGIGREEGIDIGEARGEIKGLNKGAVVFSMIAQGLDSKDIAQNNDLSIEEVERLRKKFLGIE